MIGIVLALSSAFMFSVVALIVPWAQGKNGPLAGLLAATILQLGLAWIVALAVGTLSTYTISGVILFLAAGMLAVIGNLLFFRSILLAGSAHASTGKVAAMVIGVALATTVLGEAPGIFVWIGMAIVGLGLQMLSTKKSRANISADAAQRDRLGLLYSFAGGASFAVGNLVRKQALLAWDEPFAGPAIEATGGILLLLFLPAVYSQWREASGRNIWRMGAVGAATFAGVVLFLLALQFTSLSVANVLAAAEPALTLVLLFLIGASHVRQDRRLAVGVIIATLGVCTVVVGGG